MPVRERGKFYVDNPIIGTSGTQFSKFIFGSACINAPSVLGDGASSACVAITGVVAADNVIVMPSASLQAGMILKNATTYAGGIAASFINSGSTAISASNDVAVAYIVFS